MLSEAEFSLIAREVQVRSGAVLPPSLTGAVEMRLQPLMRREAFSNVNELISAARVRTDGRLWDTIVENLAQCETRFLADRAMFKRLRDDIIPDALTRRGHERVRSRPFAQVVAEVEALIAQGVREIMLLGQNVNAYRGPMAGGDPCDLATLIRHIARFDGLERIRFTTSHPLEFRDSLVAAYAEVPKLANYLHLPVQSGSDRILSLMKRGYTRLEYRQKIRRLRTVRPASACRRTSSSASREKPRTTLPGCWR